MKVLDVKDNVNVGSNGKAYHNLTLKVGVPKDYDGVTVLKEYSIRFTSNCVEKLLYSQVIRDVQELKGKDIDAYRSAPVYLSDFEKKYNLVMCDVLVIRK